MSVIKDIEKQFPLTMSHETDCRDVWPKRWKAIKSIINVASSNGEPGNPPSTDKRYKVTVYVNPITKNLHPQDEESNPSGNYDYRIWAHDGKSASEKALDEFHSNIPIKVLEDFQIRTTVQEL